MRRKSNEIKGVNLMNRILIICVCFVVLLTGCSSQSKEVKITDTTNHKHVAQTTPSNDDKPSSSNDTSEKPEDVIAQPDTIIYKQIR